MRLGFIIFPVAALYSIACGGSHSTTEDSNMNSAADTANASRECDAVNYDECLTDAEKNATEVRCEGDRYGLQTRALITPNYDDRYARNCVVEVGSQAWSQLNTYCSDDICSFMGHVKSRESGTRTYTIDSINGPVTEDAP